MFRVLNLKSLLRYLFLLLGCLHLVGGPCALIQVYAWANMLATYSQETSLAQATVDTFSGEKPCCLCKKIAAAKSSQSESEKETLPFATSATKAFQDLFPPTIASLSDPIPLPFPCPDFPSVVDITSIPGNGPPSPPPQV